MYAFTNFSRKLGMMFIATLIFSIWKQILYIGLPAVQIDTYMLAKMLRCSVIV